VGVKMKDIEKIAVIIALIVIIYIIGKSFNWW